MTVELGKIFRAEGIRVVEEPNWRTHMRPGGFAPVGIIVHHTGVKREAADGNVVRLLREGRPDLAGPLCTAGIMETGVLHLISAGRTNHAGKGSSLVYNRVKADQPPPARSVDTVDDMTGNGYFYGFEVDHPGDASPYAEAQIGCLVRACTALVRHHKWTANRVIHHAEWTDRKIDMSWKGDIRGRVNHRLKNTKLINGVWQYPPAPTPAPEPPAPKPTPESEANMKQVLIKVQDKPSIYATDGLTITHMKSWDEIRDLTAAGVIAGDATLKSVKIVRQATIDSLPRNA